MDKTTNFISRIYTNNNIEHIDEYGYWKYTYTDTIYTNARTKVIITCNIHGDFEQLPNNHLKGIGCPKCGTISSNSNRTRSDCTFIKLANIKHNNVYTYNNTVYTHSNAKVIITCNIHGDFEQLPTVHLGGHGCQICAHSNRMTGYTKTAFAQLCERNNNGKGTLYVIECTGNSEKFYKIGITSHDVNTRFNSTRIPYNIKVLYQTINNSNIIYDLERTLLRQVKNTRYSPKEKFYGYTECFTNIDALSTVIN